MKLTFFASLALFQLSRLEKTVLSETDVSRPANQEEAEPGWSLWATPMSPLYNIINSRPRFLDLLSPSCPCSGLTGGLRAVYGLNHPPYFPAWLPMSYQMLFHSPQVHKLPFRLSTLKHYLRITIHLGHSFSHHFSSPLYNSSCVTISDFAYLGAPKKWNLNLSFLHERSYVSSCRSHFKRCYNIGT